MEVVHAIEDTEKGPGDKPKVDIIIADAGEVRSFPSPLCSKSH